MINPCREMAILWFTFCVAGTTWMTAFALMCLWDFKLRPLPVPAFTSLHECYRYKTVLCPSSPLLVFTLRCSVVNVRLFPSFFQISLPSRPLWYLLFGATEEEIKDICTTTLKLYTRKKVRPVSRHSCFKRSRSSLVCYFESVSDLFPLFFFSQIMNSWRRKWTRGRWLYRKPNWKPKDWIQMALLLSPHWVDSLLDPNHVSCHFHYLLCSLTALLLRIVYHCCSKHAWLFVWHKISRMSKLLFFFFPIQEV